MNGFWFGISLIIGIYLAISLMSEPLAQMIGIAVIPVSLLCLIIGIIIGNLVSLPSSWVRGTNYVKKNILQIAIVFLGLKISLVQVFEVELSSLALILSIFLLVFVLGVILQKIFFT